MIQKSSKMIMFAVISVIIVAVPLIIYHDVSSKPVLLTANDGHSAYLWEGNFTYMNCNFNHVSGPYWFPPIQSVTSISTNGYPNSTFYLRLAGFGVVSLIGPCVSFWLTSAGNLTPNLHPKHLIISESITAYSNGTPINTSGIHADCSHLLFSPCSTALSNFSCIPTPTSDPFIRGIGSASWTFAFQNDTSLSGTSFYHFGLFPVTPSYTNISFKMANNIYHFFPQSYNISYHTCFTALLTGLSEPVYAQVELTTQYV